MNSSIVKSRDRISLDNVDLNELSPYDSNYPIHFLKDSLREQLSQAKNVVGKVYDFVQKSTPIIKAVKESSKKDIRYVLDVTENTLDDIECGRIKLTTEKAGQTFAQIREANGHYGEKLPIKREDLAQGIDPIQVANFLQMRALQNQFEDMTYQIEMINTNVLEVLQGQQNDRIGLYYSGMALLLEAKVVTDIEFKKALMAQAVRSLSDSTFQLNMKIKEDISYLRNREYDKDKGKKKVVLIDEKINSINQSFAFIHQATMLKAGAYCEMGELNAMTNVLDDYSCFIEGTIVNNASLLAQCDDSDNGLENGVWKRRAKFKLDVSEIKKQISNQDKVFYIGVEEEEL